MQLEKQILDGVVKPCKQGEAILLICPKSPKRIVTEVKKILRTKLTEKRGLFAWNGYVAVVTNSYKNFHKYFDKIIYLEVK